MVQAHPPVSGDLFYPDADGQPMAENTIQYRWIVCLTENLRHLLADQTAFVGADLFWYPVEGSPEIVMAPDVLVALGRPGGDRRSYKQWQEENIAPQVVFEIISPSNTMAEIQKKQQFYSQYGVLEIFFYTPDTLDFWGLVRPTPADLFVSVFPFNLPWESPTLGIRFVMESAGLAVFYPDGRRFEDPQTWLRERDRAWEKLRELGIDPAQL